ncbi:hypothetical protein KC614_04390 [candidate division WWE3 bacterium]|uniref:Uncharacterized protein n=1 Tax=candidate division WWE3 bacterium TaxID=2053526 RepID=A0A955LM46_UNCKA|nr:hypothetical protein [candidate division WWE3 bacterium]
MKLRTKLALVFGVIVLLFVGSGVYVYAAFNSSTPRDLGITYTEQDLTSGRAKGKIKYEVADANTPASQSLQLLGKNKVDTSFTSAEMTAIMNNKPGTYYPYKNVQVKFNADGSCEISGQIDKSRLSTYFATFDGPQEALDIIMKVLPDDPVFYGKARASLVDNKIAIAEPQKLEIGRIGIPLGPLLSWNNPFDTKAFAMDISSIISELSQYSNKKQILIDYTNQKLGEIQGFYAEDAHFEDNALLFKGTLPAREVTVR